MILLSVLIIKIAKMFFTTYFHSIFKESYSSFYSFYIFAHNKMQEHP